MAAAATDMVHMWAEQLADSADHVLGQMPESGEWEVLRHFLQHVSSVFRRGDIRSGVRVAMRVLPYIQRGLSSVEKYNNMASTYDITATLSSHFLVEDDARKNLEEFLQTIKDKMAALRGKVESFAKELDSILEDMVQDGKDLGVFLTLKLAFTMNRISALMHTCEDHLNRARGMIDTLDTHVAGKSFLATFVSYVCFMLGIALSATGNISVGAACMTAASASRKSAQSLDDYRSRLAVIDNEHNKLQAELQEWKHRFRAEQRNFFLLVGIRKVATVLLLLALGFLLAGKNVNFIAFAAVFMYLVVKSEESNAIRYYAAMVVGMVAVATEINQSYGLAAFNTGACAILTIAYLGYIDL